MPFSGALGAPGWGDWQGPGRPESPGPAPPPSPAAAAAAAHSLPARGAGSPLPHCGPRAAEAEISVSPPFHRAETALGTWQSPQAWGQHGEGGTNAHSRGHHGQFPAPKAHAPTPAPTPPSTHTVALIPPHLLWDSDRGQGPGPKVRSRRQRAKAWQRTS